MAEVRFQLIEPGLSIQGLQPVYPTPFLLQSCKRIRQPGLRTVQPQLLLFTRQRRPPSSVPGAASP